MRKIFWQAKELRLDQQRLNSLHDLRVKEFEDLERENEKVIVYYLVSSVVLFLLDILQMKAMKTELESTLATLQESYAQKEAESQRYQTELRLKEEEKQEALNALSETQQTLTSLTEERDRLKIIEEVCSLICLCDSVSHRK